MGWFEQYPLAFIAGVALVGGVAGWLGGKLASTRPADYNDHWLRRLTRRV